MKIGIIGAATSAALSPGGSPHWATRSWSPTRAARRRSPTWRARPAPRAALATEAAEGAELVIVTIPERVIPLLPAGILDGAAPAAPIVDTGNYYPRT